MAAKIPRSLPSGVVDGFQAAKSGDVDVARRLLEREIASLDASGTRTLMELYALGEGGVVDLPKAIALIRLLPCDRFNLIGEPEFSLSKILLLHKDKPLLAGEWLVRSAEAGYLPAMKILSSENELRAAGYPNSAVDHTYWANRIANPIPQQLSQNLGRCSK